MVQSQQRWGSQLSALLAIKQLLLPMLLESFLPHFPPTVIADCIA